MDLDFLLPVVSDRFTPIPGATIPISDRAELASARAAPTLPMERKRGPAMPSICVFDVNDTLLDIDFLAPLFKRLFGDGKVLGEWFAQLTLCSETVALTSPYTTFFTLGQGVLKMLGTIHNVSILQADLEELRTRMLTMPAHVDVPAGLKQLKEAGFRLAALTSSPPHPHAGPLEHARLDGWFEKSFSIDRIRQFGPAALVYQTIAKALDVPTSEICMVAAHVWDTIGAQSAGCAGVLVARPGNGILPVPGVPQPQVVAADLPSAARQMVSLWCW
jgi:2-haloacid dehalogenase